MLNTKTTLITILLLLIGIATAFAQSFDVNCEKPGKLKKQFKKVELTSVKDLKISGLLNEKDFEYLQQFTNLETLDLTKASIPQKISVCSLSRLSILKVASDCEISISDGQCLDELHVFDGHKVSLKNGRLYNDIVTAVKLYQYKGNDYNYGVNSAYTYYMENKQVRFNPRLEGWNITKITPESVKNHPILKYFYEVNAFANYVFWDSKIEEIQLPDKVKNLNENCFRHCYKLKKVVINGELNSVGDYCFNDCTSLEEIDIHAKTIGKDCFSGCTSLKKVTIIADVALGDDCFYKCSNLEEITIKAPIIRHLSGSNNVKKFKILEGVRVIEPGGLVGCYNGVQDTLILPNSLDECFAGALSIRTEVLVIKNKSMRITGQVGSCDIKRIIIPEGSYQNFKDSGLKNMIEEGPGVSYSFKIDQPGTILSYLPINDMHKVDSLTISGVLYEYDLDIIRKCHNMRYLDLHNAFFIKSPERYEQEKNSLGNFIVQAAALYLDVQSWLATGQSLGAFDYVDDVIDKEYNKQFSNDFYFPQGLLKYHVNIETVVLPIYTTEIAKEAFYKCTSLKNIIIPSSLKQIGEKAFYNCISLNNITIPQCDYIRDNAFEKCSSLKSIIFKGKVIEISCIKDCKDLAKLNLPDGIEKFGGIEDCPNVTDIYFPASIRTISQIESGAKDLNLHFKSIKAPEIYRVNRNKMNIFIPKGSITSYYKRLGDDCTYIEE